MEFYYEFGPGFEHNFGHNIPVPIPDAVAPDFGGLAAVLLAVLIPVLLTVIAFGVAVYVMQALSLYTMAQKRGIANAWLAWVPVGSSWILGALADDINARQGKKTNYGLILLVATAVTAAGSASLFLLPFLGLFAAPLSIAVMVVYYMALYEIYRDYAPQNAVLFLVLSILLSVHWILLFVLRGRRPVTLGGADASQPKPEAPQQVYSVPPQPAPVQPQPQQQPPAGWSPDPAFQQQAPVRQQACPPEHWGGIMTVEQSAPHQQENHSPENTNNGITIKGDNNDEQDPA